MLSIQSQPSLIHISLVHIPHPDSVANFIKYTPHEIGTAIKTSRPQLQLNIIQVPETKYSPLFSLQVPSETGSTTFLQLFSPLKPIRNLSPSMSNLLDNFVTDNKPSQDSNRILLVPHSLPFNYTKTKILILQNLTSPLVRVIQPLVLYDNKLNQLLLLQALLNTFNKLFLH